MGSGSNEKELSSFCLKAKYFDREMEVKTMLGGGEGGGLITLLLFAGGVTFCLLARSKYLLKTEEIIFIFFGVHYFSLYIKE